MINSPSAPVQFCTDCKNLLLDSELCGRCGRHNELLEKEIITERKYPGAKAWSQKVFKVEKATTNIECSNCNGKEMYYTSRQMRSADEGETVFLECISCRHKSIV